MSLFLCNEYSSDLSLKLVIFRVCIDSKKNLPFAHFILYSFAGKFLFVKMSVDLFQIPVVKN